MQKEKDKDECDCVRGTFVNMHVCISAHLLAVHPQVQPLTRLPVCHVCPCCVCALLNMQLCMCVPALRTLSTGEKAETA